ncbi:Bug family tripartite tricarboxylate transporter substrate binding protein [Falsiroseomonas sp. HW251]|uniref:Bug family tripartite tricarboxylate transporter substrate binding protein n=1 Tax=Falsiroseomonas sp. HW251 TaxID=3390998 RepID=UPI003D31C0ED
MIRRRATLLAGAALALPSIAQAQSPWPSRPVRILISFPPGGSSDYVARVIAPAMSEMFGQQFIVENKPGAGGMLAAEQLKREPADGHVFLLSNNAPFTIAPTMFPRITYDVMRDFTHIAYLGATYGGFVTHPSTGVRTVAEAVAKAKAQPGKLTFGSSGVGSIGHITGNTFAGLAGIEILHVPYRGAGPLRVDLSAGTVGMAFEGLVTNLPAIRAGALNGLAVTAEQRLSLAPDVPTFRELGYDIVVKNWHGLSGPPSVPAPIVGRLQQGLAEICVRRAITDQFMTIGNFFTPMTTAEFNAFVAAEIALWRPMILAADAVDKG